MKAAISTGTRPQGQAPTQAPQRMQGPVAFSLTSLLVRARMPPVPLTTGTSEVGSGKPIIGPPEISR